MEIYSNQTSHKLV